MQGFCRFSSDQGTSLSGGYQKVFRLPGANSGTGSAPSVQGDTELTGPLPDPPGAYPRQLSLIHIDVYKRQERRVLEDHNYEKFFHAVRTADTDKWDLEGQVVNSSFKPFARSLLTGIENTVNSCLLYTSWNHL